MEPFRMLLVDLDGTALTGHDSLREDDVAAARALRERGVEVSIATGRLVGGTDWVADALGVRGGYAVMNGSARYSTQGHELHHHAVPEAQLRNIGEAIRRADLEPFHFLSHRIHHDPRGERHRDYLGIWTPEVHPEPLGTAETWARTDVLAVGAVGDPHAVERVLELVDHDDLELVAFDTFGGERFLSIRMGHHDKGTALEDLARERGISPEQVVAVGDWWNDVPMLRRAGLGLAMGGAGPKATEAADEVLEAQRGQGGAIAEIASKVWGV